MEDLKINITNYSKTLWWNLWLNDILPIVAIVDEDSQIIRNFALGREFEFDCYGEIIATKWDMKFHSLQGQSNSLIKVVECIYYNYHHL